MQVFSTFEYSSYIELAVSELEKKGIKKEDIFIVPLNNRTEDRRLFDSLHRADGVSLIDLGMALATAFSVIGASIGFKLSWGPIYWGIIGAFIGFILGLGIKLFMFKVIRKNQRLLRGKHSEVILIVDCNAVDAGVVEQTLWKNLALGVSQVRSDGL
ncbi:hypothetical protein [Priestia megaterium]|uniref:hypothetical protein n=1 Tax=Priestia megaterium TaxID=1404 RepID=UPI000BF8E433|nr:hypothetical protein [Priestia megaterium]MCM3153682.1 hypothetical protein [Priestia megaterium]PEU70129.1 hypothetical protein CN397_11130 [Priestia megaterium]PFQ78527.1 hypothetical protein COK11_23175 [Priestia megaterium]PFW50226.1 hypothetical protein COL17_09435 [Priestia megaterium]PGR03911.1 hypothetical protein COA23_20865 [Priestia megaterium]